MIAATKRKQSRRKEEERKSAMANSNRACRGGNNNNKHHIRYLILCIVNVMSCHAERKCANVGSQVTRGTLERERHTSREFYILGNQLLQSVARHIRHTHKKTSIVFARKHSSASPQTLPARHRCRRIASAFWRRRRGAARGVSRMPQCGAPVM